VPLILSWPGRFPAGLKSDALVELIDLAPTLLSLGGAAIPDRVQGRTLLPILMQGSDPSQHRAYVRSEYFHTLNPDVPGREHFNGSYATMLRDHRYKLVVYHGHDVGELFDLDEDPGEFENLWDSGAHEGVRFDLMKRSFDALAFAVDIGPRQITYW
jgi:arylsulfatase A-like enzyme